MRGVMDAVSDPAVREVVVMSAAQVGKTEVLLNIIGYHIDQDAAPMLIVQPTLSMAQAFSKDRLAPMVRDTGVLKGKIKDPRTRDSNNTTLHKVFNGGMVTIAGANSAAGLASRPVRIVLCDEVDRYPSSAGTEGDPVRLAEKRASTFWNSKIVTVSTPTVKNASRIEAEYLSSDQREYWVPCRHCDEPQIMRWASVQWQTDQPETAVYVCEHCGVVWSDADRLKAIKRGEWRASAEFRGVAGFRLSGLVSPWLSIAEAARDFVEAKKLPETLRVWVNTFLGETWEESGDGVDDTGIADRREDYEGCPDGVVLLTAGCDVQDDRLEVELVGWGRDEESWSIDYRIFYGDPSSPAVWADLDSYLAETWQHPRGIDMPIRAACIDSGGHHTQAVYTFCRPREGRRIFAIKGVGGEGRALVGRPTRNNVGKVRLFSIGVDSAKELIYARLKIAEPGPGYCHFPARYDDEYFRQLTAETIVTRFAKGFRKREWKKQRVRNDALDCRVYALAAYALLNARINTLADRFARPQKDKSEPLPERALDTPPRRSVRRQSTNGGFVNSWR